MPSRDVTCWGSCAASMYVHPSALPARASRLVLFLPFGVGPTPLLFGSSGLNAQQNILSFVEPAAKNISAGEEEKRWCEVGQEGAEEQGGAPGKRRGRRYI